MKDPHQKDELLLRLLDQNVTEEERELAYQILRTNARARDFLRMVAEHAVVAADNEGFQRGHEADRTELFSSQTASPLAASGEKLDTTQSQSPHLMKESSSLTPSDERGSASPPIPPLGPPDSRSLGKRPVPFAQWIIPTGTIALGFLLLAAWIAWQSSSDQRIATITGIGGPVIWTGDGGIVTREVEIGTTLGGGTIEAVTPDSWAEVEFVDGTTLTLAGSTLVTFSDHGQKKVYLRKGNVSANVAPQPDDLPLLVHTHAAVLEVLGTQFQVESKLASTALNVNEGKVRVRRLSDGSTVDVPANHRVIAAADRDLSLSLAPSSVSHWESQLNLGPARTHGKWIPKSEDSDAKLRSIPYTLTTRRGKTLTLYNTSFQVSSGEGPRVLLAADSRLRVCGLVRTPQIIHVGITVQKPNGDFAGNFETYVPAKEFVPDADFEFNLCPSEFQLDPSLIDMRDQLPDGPDGLVISSVWVHSLNRPAGLEISKIELLPPTSPSHRD